MDFFVSRQRPALGECLASLAAAIPVAFLEPALNRYNPLSVFNTKTPRERSSKYHPTEVITHMLRGRQWEGNRPGRDCSPQHCWLMWSERGQEVRTGTLQRVSILLEQWIRASTFFLLNLGFLLCKMRRQTVDVSIPCILKARVLLSALVSILLLHRIPLQGHGEALLPRMTATSSPSP